MNVQIYTHTITSIQELLAQVHHLQNNLGFEKVWFRGIADQEYGLEPSIFWKVGDSLRERILLNKFKTKARPYLQSYKDNYWEWLFLMQHYGIPTRLLDWSESALASLAFSTLYREDKHNGKDAALWCLDPIKLNRDYVREFRPDELIPNILDETVRKIQVYMDPEIPNEFPIAVYGPLNNERITSQKGVFTVFPFKERFKLEDLPQSNHFLAKLTIPYDNITDIRHQLVMLGMTETMIYPGLDSLSKEINREIIG